ncbi:MAG: carboxypeptidase regulatory-like domain-containing protein, partial [Deltaproteobacteria bacterium]|nr:carboxypeptidase regulatory-like domain-containing protein [Deltaproteobacteria bacterium]
LLLSSKLWGGGVLSGVIRYEGQLPEHHKKPVTIDADICGHESSPEDLVVGKNGGKKGALKNVVVFIQGAVSGGQSFSRSKQHASLDQKGCRFDPHIVLVPLGADLEILNSDGVLHGFHTLSRTNPPMNKAQPASTPKMVVRFQSPEIFEIRCDVHDWMRGWIVVEEHPYYSVSDEEGHFRLQDLPAGNYTVRVWHEVLGMQSKRVQIVEGQETRADFKMSSPASP